MTDPNSNRAEAQAIVEFFDDQLEAIEDHVGVEFSDSDRERIYRQSLAGGLEPDAIAEAAVGVLSGSHGIEPEAIVDLADGESVEAAGTRLERDFTADLDRLERDLDRPLLRQERKAIIDRTGEFVERHDALPEDFAMHALREHHKGDLPDKSTTEGRTWLATERLRESEEPDPGDDPQYDELDLSNREDRLRYGVAKHIHGLEFEDDDTEPEQDTDNPDLAEAA